MNKLKQSVFFTADLHFGHAHIIKYDNRPFNSLQDMHRSLIKQFNATVPANGLTYFLGDIGITSSVELGNFINKLNGTKVLILGNHDKGSNAMYNIGFDVVVHGVTLYIAQEKVTLTHCPLRGVFREDVTGMKGANENDYWHGEHKNDKFSVEDEGQFHLHGHIHSPKLRRSLNRQYDVGVRANEYRPVSISQVESWITKTKKEEL
ncbi:MAG: hypothetical protein DRQ88_05910 [Epsilonproteobacteria bacterium]|nr:MAG: hypothetical protein DRQ88_05910 [Campylobacterota bacterium]